MLYRLDSEDTRDYALETLDSRDTSDYARVQVGEVEACSYFYGFLFPPSSACLPCASLSHSLGSLQIFPIHFTLLHSFYCTVLRAPECLTDRPADKPKSSSLSLRPAATTPSPSILLSSVIILINTPIWTQHS